MLVLILQIHVYQAVFNIFERKWYQLYSKCHIRPPAQTGSRRPFKGWLKLFYNQAQIRDWVTRFWFLVAREPLWLPLPRVRLMVQLGRARA